MKELFKKKLKLLHPELRSFVLGPFIPELTQIMVKESNLDQELIDALKYELYLYSMLSIDETELREAITKLLVNTQVDIDSFTDVILESFPAEFRLMQTMAVRNITDPSPNQSLQIMAETLELNSAQKDAFYSLIDEVLVGELQQTKLPSVLVERLEIERPAAMRITADVLDFLAPLDEPQPDTGKAATAVPINNAEPVNDNSLASEIAEAEAAIESMQPIRTMSHDMEVQRGTPADEPTHTGASQADLLDRTATVKDKNPGATWGTEQT